MKFYFLIRAVLPAIAAAFFCLPVLPSFALEMNEGLCRNDYQPVCGIPPRAINNSTYTHTHSWQPAQLRTYRNLCVLKQDNAIYLYDGECVGGPNCSSFQTGWQWDEDAETCEQVTVASCSGVSANRLFATQYDCLRFYEDDGEECQAMVMYAGWRWYDKEGTCLQTSLKGCVNSRPGELYEEKEECLQMNLLDDAPCTSFFDGCRYCEVNDKEISCTGEPCANPAPIRCTKKETGVVTNFIASDTSPACLAAAETPQDGVGFVTSYQATLWPPECGAGIMNYLRHGQEVKVLGKKGDWYRVVAGNYYGWVKTSTLRVQNECADGYAPVCGRPPAPVCPGADMGLECLMTEQPPKTYVNICTLRNMGATLLYEGECRDNCAADGQKVYQSANLGPVECCNANAGIKSSAFLSDDKCVAPRDGSLGTCVLGWGQTCGDGYCDKNQEDFCNCPDDCSLHECSGSSLEWIFSETDGRCMQQSVPCSEAQYQSRGSCTLSYIKENYPGCTTYYDGCNLCQIVNAGLIACTERACLDYGKPECRSLASQTFSSDSSLDDNGQTNGSRPWYDETVQRFQTAGYVSAASFNPAKTLTIGEVIDLIVKIKYGPAGNCVSQYFDDVPFSSPYCAVFQKAAEEGIIAGEDNCALTGERPCNAKPGEPASRVRTATILSRAYNLDPNITTSENHPGFTDNTVDWARSHINAAARWCILRGDDGKNTVRPMATVSYPEFLRMLERAERVQNYPDCDDDAPVAIPVYSQSAGKTEPVLGGDKDEHGCIGSAGYTWCESKQKCLRPWEEPCNSVEKDPFSNPAEKCATYYRNGQPLEKCAVCGNKICEDFEKCVPSNCSDAACTKDCGPLYCPGDCSATSEEACGNGICEAGEADYYQAKECLTDTSTDCLLPPQLITGICPQDCTDENAAGGPVKYGECGDGQCNNGENTPSYPYYCPQDCD